MCEPKEAFTSVSMGQGEGGFHLPKLWADFVQSLQSLSSPAETCGRSEPEGKG